MFLRCELFTTDLEATLDFYCRVLRFTVGQDDRSTTGYISLHRGSAVIGVLESVVDGDVAARRPPLGVELVLEVDDVSAEVDRVVARGWPLAEELRARPWGLTDFRLLDPSGYYLRITDRR